jgi:hypothetical protein
MPELGILDATLTKEIETRFTYHPPGGDQATRYGLIRDKAKEFAYVLAENCPKSPDLTKALNHLDIAVMLANASIARNETHEPLDCPPDADFFANTNTAGLIV